MKVIFTVEYLPEFYVSEPSITIHLKKSETTTEYKIICALLDNTDGYVTFIDGRYTKNGEGLK